MNLNKLVQELIEVEKKRVILLEKIAENGLVNQTQREEVRFSEVIVEPTIKNIYDRICAKCVHKNCFDCGVDCDQEYAEERFAGEGWDRELIMKYACRKSMAKETGKCKFYSEDPATVVVCAECKHCILGEKGPMSMMTGNCLIDKVGTFDEYMGCPYGEKK